MQDAEAGAEVARPTLSAQNSLGGLNMSPQNNVLSEQITANIAYTPLCFHYLSSWSPLNFHRYKNSLENFCRLFKYAKSR